MRFQAVADPGRFVIASLALKNPNASNEDIAYQGPDFQRWDRNLQKGFYRYLKARGVEQGIIRFLFNYMARKEHRKYTAWMNNLRNVMDN